MPPRPFSARAYSAAPLADEQRNEVLRLVDECNTVTRHDYRVMLDGARDTEIRLVKDDPTNAEVHRYAAVALQRALELLDICWPEPDLTLGHGGA